MTSPIVIKDFINLVKVSDVQISRNKIYFVEKRPDLQSNSYTSCIKQLDLETSETKQFTAGTKSDFHPRVSPNGKMLAFISTRGDKPQIYLMEITGGEALVITKVKNGVMNFTWAPDSTKLVFAATWKEEDDKEAEDEKNDNIDPRENAEHEKIREKYLEQSLTDPRVIDQIIFKTGTSFIDHSRTVQLFIYDLETKDTTRISGDNYQYGTPEWRGHNHVVVYRKDRDMLVHMDHLVEINIDTREEKELYENYNPLIFPFKPEVNQYDTNKILTRIFEEGYFPGKLGQIAKYTWLGKEKKIVNKELDRPIYSPKFINENEAYIRVDSDGYARIHHWNTDTNAFTQIYEPEFSTESFTISENVIVITGTAPRHPSAIWKTTIDSDGDNKPVLIYDPNAVWLKDRDIIEPSTHFMTNEHGTKFQYWIFEPKTSQVKPPMLLSLHGGPHVMWNNAGSMWHEWRLQAAMGYLVVAPNPVGSEGYGEEFMRVITANWGNQDGKDEMQLVRHLLKEGRADPNRLFATGGSYAGFQVANLITTYTDFTAACAQRGVYNLTNLHAGSDVSHFGELEYDGPVWERLEKLWEDSPVSRVANASCPILLIHSENDFRVPIAQADEFYAGLKTHGKTVKYVRYPRDGHELSRSGEPIHLLDRLKKMMDWFEEYNH